MIDDARFSPIVLQADCSGQQTLTRQKGDAAFAIAQFTKHQKDAN